jgi:hypothetical protein
MAINKLNRNRKSTFIRKDANPSSRDGPPEIIENIVPHIVWRFAKSLDPAESSQNRERISPNPNCTTTKNTRVHVTLIQCTQEHRTSDQAPTLLFASDITSAYRERTSASAPSAAARAAICVMG